MLNNKIHIVLLTDCMANTQAGAEKQIFELAKRLDKKIYTVTIASLESDSVTPRDLIKDIDCQLQTFPLTRIYGLSGLKQGLRFKNFLKENKVDIIQTYHFGSDIFGTFWAKLAGVPRIISNRRDMGFWRKPHHVMAYRLINHWVNKIVTVTSSIKEMVIKTEGVSGERIEVIYNGVDLPSSMKDTTSKKQELGMFPEDIVIAHVANLRPVKGHQYLIRAFAETVRNFPNTKLLLIGKDELNGELQTLAHSLGLTDKILFLGTRTDVTQLLSIADVCVLPSLSEGMSNAILEYMASAKPIIATRVGGNPELIRDGYNGILVEKENVQQLSEALKQLLNDKNKRQWMGANGLTLIKEGFSMEAMLNKYTSLFQIKVLHLISSGGLFGAEQVVLTLAGCKDGITHVIGAIDNAHNPHLEITEEAQKQGIKTAVFKSQGRFDLKVIKEVANFAKNNAIDIIHTHNYKANFIGFPAARCSHKKWMVTAHGWTGTDSKLKWYEILDRFLLKFSNKLVCVSDANYQMLLRKSFNPQHLSMISNGINLNTFSKKSINSYLRNTFNIETNDVVLTIVGRLSPEKGHEIVLQALKLIIPQYSSIKCLIVGDGPLKGSLEDQVKDLNLSSHVIFTGIRKDMANIYGICDILINASYTEGLPMTILEAMAAQVSIIASSVGAIPTTIKDQVSGLLLKPGDSKTLAEAILKLIKDPVLRKKLTQEAYQDVTTSFSDQAMFFQYKKLYEELARKQ